MKAVGIVRPSYVMLSTSLVERVCLWKRAPMQCTDHTVPSIGVVVPIIAPTLGNINLSAGRPIPIHIRFGHHPDSRPKPRALGHLCDDLDLSVLDCLLAFGIEACAAHRVNDGAGSLVATDGAHSVVLGGARPGSSKVENISIVYVGKGDVCALSGERWDNMQTGSIDIGVLWVVCRPFERSAAEASALNLVIPYFRVNGLE